MSTGQRRLGVFHLQERIGAGGMGEVYRARDTRLGRDVAVKLLPATPAGDQDRLARLEREARVLASLNHPNIASIYGIEDSDGVLALVMELVEGDTLAERLARGALPAGDALVVARQLAHALDAAHEKGIVHRDLKPANIKLTVGGAIKVLDFGLARGMTVDHATVDVSHAPTLPPGSDARGGARRHSGVYESRAGARSARRQTHRHLGVRGGVVRDAHRSPRLCAGSVADTVAAVLDAEPDWQAIPVAVPSAVRNLIRKCLAKIQRNGCETLVMRGSRSKTC